MLPAKDRAELSAMESDGAELSAMESDGAELSALETDGAELSALDCGFRDVSAAVMGDPLLLRTFSRAVGRPARRNRLSCPAGRLYNGYIVDASFRRVAVRGRGV